jgi:hypothetical protein
MDIFESSDLEDLGPQPGVHTSSPPGEPFPRTSIGEGSDVSERVTVDISESFNLEDVGPQPGVQSNVGMKEWEHTESDEDELGCEE